MIPTLMVMVMLAAQQPAPAPAPVPPTPVPPTSAPSAIPAAPSSGQVPEIAVLKAGLGPCSANFTVKDAAGAPVYAAAVHVRVRYGLMGVKRADLEVGTNSDGKARIEGLPKKAKPLTYEIQKDGRRAAAHQDVATDCSATFDATLK